MKLEHFVSFLCLMAVVAVANVPVHVAADVSQADYARGQSIAAQCAVCHGANGRSHLDGLPHLANQHFNYLVRQLREMKKAAAMRAGVGNAQTGVGQDLLRRRRSNTAMDEAVMRMSDRDILDVSLFYASQTCIDGTWSDVPLPKIEIRCRSCHGAVGVSKNTNVPNIAGQNRTYIEAQLRAFRDRTPDAAKARRAKIMEGQAKHVSDADISALARYYSALPCGS